MTTTEILSTVHDTEVIDIGLIYLEECRYMFHTMRVKIFCYGLEILKCPRCDSMDSFIDRQYFNEYINMLNDIYIPKLKRDAIEGNNIGGNNNDDITTDVATITDTGGDNVDDDSNNDDDKDNNNNKDNNDDDDNNDENKDDNDNYDDNPIYYNQDICDICQNKYIDTTPEDLRITSYQKKYKDIIISVVSIANSK